MASRGINKATIVGNLGNEPDLRILPNGQACCTISVATSEVWKEKDTGEIKTDTEWHRVVIWGKLAEIAGKYAHKGTKVYVEGKLKTRKWQDQNGVDRYTTEVVVQSIGGVFQLLDKIESDGSADAQSNPLPATPSSLPPEPSAADFDDDIPF